MRRPIWNAIERKLDDYSLRKKFYIFYVLCVMLPLIVTDAVVLSIVENAEKESSRHEMSSIASAVGYNLNSMVNNAEDAAKSIYTSKRIDDFISKEYTSSAEYVSEYQSFFQDTLFENTLGMSNIVFFLYADNPTIVNGGKVNDMSAVRNMDSYNGNTAARTQVVYTVPKSFKNTIKALQELGILNSKLYMDKDYLPGDSTSYKEYTGEYYYDDYTSSSDLYDYTDDSYIDDSEY